MSKIVTVLNLLRRTIKLHWLSYTLKNSIIEEKKIVFWSYRGRAYSCNPKYITEKIIHNYSDKGFKIVWAFNEPEKYTYLQKKGIVLVKYYSKEFFRELLTAHFIITNTRFGIDFHKRTGQVYIQTYHGTLPLKMVEADAEKSLSKSYVLNAKADSKKTDYLISSSKFMSMLIKNSFWYKGKVLEFGNPRNDIFFETEKWGVRIRNYYGIKQKKLILYAPTFRRNEKKNIYNIDFQRLLRAMRKRFGENYVILCRLHPNLKGKRLVDGILTDVIDVTDYDDMQELLAGCDVLITDFSSSVFDAVIMKKRVFLYATDYEDYIKNDRALYFDVKDDLPFSFANNNEELINNIYNFDDKKYQADIDTFAKKVAFFDKGDASQRVVQLMESICEKQ